MLVGKGVKYGGEDGGKRSGGCKGGKFVRFGEYGLEGRRSCWMRCCEMECGGMGMRGQMKGGGKVWIKML